jgi:hypothetical protein
MAKGIGDVLYNLLSNDVDVSAIVGTKIYPFIAIEDVQDPYIVYTIEGVDPTQDKDGPSVLDTITVNIELYTETLSELEDLGNKVRALLDRNSGIIETICVQSISFTAEDSGYADEDRVYLKIQSYSIRVTK